MRCQGRAGTGSEPQQLHRGWLKLRRDERGQGTADQGGNWAVFDGVCPAER